MTTPVAPVPIPAGTAVPSRSGDQAAFDNDYEAFYVWEKDDLAPGMSALAAATYTNALAAVEAAEAAADSGAAAALSAAAADDSQTAAALSAAAADDSQTAAALSAAAAASSQTAAAESALSASNDASAVAGALASIADGPVYRVNGQTGDVVIELPEPTPPTGIATLLKYA